MPRGRRVSPKTEAEPGSALPGLVRSLRPHQWTKNVFVFGALVFSQHLFERRSLLLALLAFVVFCAVSSSIYLTNDIMDREQDRLHPHKRRRPIASGQVPVGLAAATAVALFALGVALSGALGPRFLAVVLIYAALSYAYCFGLKRIVIIDVMVLASGYALRAVGGAVAIQVDFSNWLLLCTSLLALFLGFCKRRQELTSLLEGAVAHRAVLARYTVSFLDQMIAVVTAATLISYIFYALSEEVAARLHTHRLGFTIPFVLYGIFRYFYLVHVRGEGGRPAREVLADTPLLVNVALYGMAVVLILYWYP